MRRRPAISLTSILAKTYQRNLKALTQATVRTGTRVASQVRREAVKQLQPPPGPGDWLSGLALGPAGARRYHLYRPPGLQLRPGEKLPLMVMLHGCGQTGRNFAASTRMNRLAARERFFVLYPEQDRLANPQGCWNWYDQRSGKAAAEAATLMAAVEQVRLLYPVDRERVAVAGLSAGASMAALLATRWPLRFRAVAMHSGVAPSAAKSPVAALGAMQGRQVPSMSAVVLGETMDAAALAATLPPLLVLHGDADAVVSVSNARSSAALWAVATGARPGVERTLRRGERHAMQVTHYRRQGRTFVTLCVVQGLGHAWSGGAASLPFSDARGPDASRMIWAFAARQFASAAAGASR